MISVKGKHTFNFIKCEHCGTDLQMDTNRLALHLLLPLFAVGLCMLISIFLIDNIVLKALIIIGGSLLIYRWSCVALIKKGFFTYHIFDKSE